MRRACLEARAQDAVPSSDSRGGPEVGRYNLYLLYTGLYHSLTLLLLALLLLALLLVGWRILTVRVLLLVESGLRITGRRRWPRR